MVNSFNEGNLTLWYDKYQEFLEEIDLSFYPGGPNADRAYEVERLFRDFSLWLSQHGLALYDTRKYSLYNHQKETVAIRDPKSINPEAEFLENLLRDFAMKVVTAKHIEDYDSSEELERIMFHFDKTLSTIDR